LSYAEHAGAAQEDSELVADVWNALAEVTDPCHSLSGHALSILDLGLVNRVTPIAGEIEIGITLTEVSCTFGYRIIEEIEGLGRDFPEFSRFRVVIEPYPLWTPDRLSDRARSHYRDTRIRFGPRMAKRLSPVP
jgi:metal-sulfur cluster biosynthetic enzyme